MLLGSEPYHTFVFGSLGQTTESMRKSAFFQWFHMVETERRPEWPSHAARFRPSGEKFHDLCYLDALLGASGDLVRMELVVNRAFVDGADALFAQDLVKSFLAGALPQACQHLLTDFMREISTPGGNGETPGFQVFRGRRPAWRVQTGWSRLLLANLPLTDAPVFIVQVGPNPTGAQRTADRRKRRRRMKRTVIKRTTAILGLLTIPAAAADFLSKDLGSRISDRRSIVTGPLPFPWNESTSTFRMRLI